MKSTSWKLPIALLLILTVVLPVFFVFPAPGSAQTAAQDPIFYGVTYGGNTTWQAEALIDKVKGYANLFVVANWDIDLNETALTEICQYAYDANMYFMVYFSFVFFNGSQLFPGWMDLFTNAGIEPFHTEWLSTANDRWGDKFLGAYVLDEPGGKQIDNGHYSGFSTTYVGRNQTTFANTTSYSDAANRFIRGLSGYYIQRLNNASYRGSIPNATGRVIPVFTADNALYWFDYLAGYDCVFTELGWNNSRAQVIGLCRGAAEVQQKDWGAIITWTYMQPPYLASGPETYQDMVTAYDAGAKYVILFDYYDINQTYLYGTLADEHFTALQQFHDYVNNHPRDLAKTKATVALVLPKDYGWGMRQGTDNIWGIWPPDNLTAPIGQMMVNLINQYGYNLDIIYNDTSFNFTQHYQTLYYWNGTVYPPPQPFFLLTMPTALYASIAAVAIVAACVPSYFIVRNKKRRGSQVTVQAATAPSSKATLKTVGEGQLSIAEDTIRFQTSKGRLKKRKNAVKEIAFADIEAVKRVGNQLSLTAKGVTDVFILESPALLETISARANERLSLQKAWLEEQEAQKKAARKAISVSLGIVDSLFDVLLGLQEKWVDWDSVEADFKCSRENTANLLKDQAVTLDFSALEEAVQQQVPKETSKQTYNLLAALHEYFALLAVLDTLGEDTHPNYRDAKTALLAYYTLNDLILSLTVGDKDTQKETTALSTLLEKLPNADASKEKITELTELVNRLVKERGNEDSAEEARTAFRSFLSGESSA